MVMIADHRIERDSSADDLLPVAFQKLKRIPADITKSKAH